MIYGIRYRRGLFGKLIVQVKVSEIRIFGTWPDRVYLWRDARVEDLPNLVAQD